MKRSLRSAVVIALLASPVASPAAEPTPIDRASAAPAAHTSPAPAAPAPAPAARTASVAKAHDRLDLDSTSITGNRELPKVMSIVPWKDAEPPAGPDRPMNSLVEEVLSPIDRDEFRREVSYFGDLTTPARPDIATTNSTSPGVKQP
ncbi:MAG: hypothetical protein U1F08_13045 [Steroidobacteraceae bacterium]